MSRRTDRCYERFMALFGLVALSAMLPAQSVNAGVKTRQFTFENGTVGGSAGTVQTSITGPFTAVPDAVFGGVATDFFDTGGIGIPDGQPLADWIAANYDPTPDFTAQGTAPTYVNVANASPLDSPAPGSTIGLQFNGTNSMTGQGFRGTFITDAARAANDAAANGGITAGGPNVQTSFTVFHQAWVRPAVAGQGTVQTVWAIGTDLGAPRITADGFWEMANVSVIPDTKTTKPVVFGQWQHVAILRTGGAATLYINGAVAVAAQNFFGAFPTEAVLGNSLDGTQPFNGVIDNFSMGGTGGLGFVVATDIDYFTDLGLPQPSGVAGDVNQDGQVNQTDYNIWSTNVGFNNTFGQGDLTTLVKGDLDVNGIVDFFDFRIIARQAAAAGVTLSVPEPASAALIAVLAIAGLTCRRAAVVR
jgi:hypothetical protein